MTIAALEDAAAAGLRALPDWRGKANLALAYRNLRGQRARSTGAWDLRLADGSQMRLPRASVMSWTVAATGYWDRPVIDLVERFIAPGTLVLDVGASVGLWAVPLARIAQRRGGLVWCFEPNPENIPWLTANLDANGLRAIAEIHAVAAGARRGTARLGLREPGGGNGMITADRPGVEVEVRPIDEFDLPRRVSFVKMDVEGFELEVMHGMRGLLARDRPAILGEFNAVWLRDRGEDLAAHLRELVAFGYDVFTLEQRRSAPQRAKDVAGLRRLHPPFGPAPEDLVLLPSR